MSRNSKAVLSAAGILTLAGFGGLLWYTQNSSMQFDGDSIILPDQITCVAISPTGRQAAFGLTSGIVGVWDHLCSASWTQVAVCGGPLRSVDYLPGGDGLICLDKKGEAWTVVFKPQARRPLAAHHENRISAVFPLDSNKAIVCFPEGIVRVVDTVLGNDILESAAQAFIPYAAVKDGTWLVGSHNGRISRLALGTGAIQDLANPLDLLIVSCAASGTCAFYSSDYDVVIGDMANLSELGTLFSSTIASALALSDDGRTVALSQPVDKRGQPTEYVDSVMTVVSCWAVDGPTHLKTVRIAPHSSNVVRLLRLSSRAEYAVAADENNTLYVFQLLGASKSTELKKRNE